MYRAIRSYAVDPRFVGRQEFRTVLFFSFGNRRNEIRNSAADGALCRCPSTCGQRCSPDRRDVAVAGQGADPAGKGYRRRFCMSGRSTFGLRACRNLNTGGQTLLTSAPARQRLALDCDYLDFIAVRQKREAGNCFYAPKPPKLGRIVDIPREPPPGNKLKWDRVVLPESRPSRHRGAGTGSSSHSWPRRVRGARKC